MEIILLRHGRPKASLKGTIKGNELGRLAAEYDASGIIDTPPAEIQITLSSVDLVVCSNLRRSCHSAQALGFSDIHSSDELFRESSMPYSEKGSIHLPIMAWLALYRALWLCGYSRNGESISATKQRAQQASETLASLAEHHGRVLLVGHGLFNHFIAKQLLANHWQGPSSPGRKHWAYGIYRFPHAK